MTQEPTREVEEDDHDLLTFDESGTRLQEEIAAIEGEIDACTDAERGRLAQRRDALAEALQRNSRYAETRPGETGFLTYTPPPSA